VKRNAKAILLIVGLLLIVIALNFAFFVDRSSSEEDERSGDRSSYKSSPFGTLAFYTLLEESKLPVARFERPFTELKEHDPGTLFVISPPDSHSPDEKEFEAVNKWVESGGLLIIIDREINITVGDANVRTENAESKSALRALQPTPFTRNVERVALSEFATRVKVDSRSATYHYGDDQAAVLADAAVGKGRVILLTDPHIVANNGISDADNVILALNLLTERPTGKIAFDEYHHGYGASTVSGGVISYFRGTPVPWMMLQAAFVTALIVYTRGRRFGRAIPLKRERRTTNLEFVSSMANITRLARATDLAMENIYSEFKKRLCRFGGVPPKSDNHKLASAVSLRGGLDAQMLAELLSRCESAVHGAPITETELLKLATRIREIETGLGL